MSDQLPHLTCPDCGDPLPPDSPQALCPACLMRQALASRTIGDGGNPVSPPPTPDEIADNFPGFEILECLGRGGMGVVYKARQKSLHRLVAIKILPPERVGDEKFAERFSREAQTLARLNHPNIVTVFDHGQAGGLFYIVMEFVDGVNLRDLLRDGKLEPKQALAIIPPICDALQFAHDKGIVHRDIKPENLLLDKEGRVKIADFGIAKLMDAAAPESDRRAPDGEEQRHPQPAATFQAGTRGYSAPEQSSGTVDHRADIYALGVVLYEMLTGERPDKDVVAPSRKVPLDVRIDEIVLRAMEKTPELRYQTAREFRTVLAMASEEMGSERIPSPVSAAPTGNTETQPGVISQLGTAALAVDASYAGFWKRFLAFIIDYNVVSIVIFPFVVALAVIAPGSVVVSVPFNLFTKEHVVESKQSEQKNTDGSTTAVDEKIVEVTVLGRWTYLYRDEIKHSGGQEAGGRHLIDPVSKKKIEERSPGDIAIWVLMIYWIFMESSIFQASLGKMAVGIRVCDGRGGRIGLARAAARNASKLLSVATLMIGFMMAGWTRRKQALHDIASDCFVTVGPPSRGDAFRKGIPQGIAALIIISIVLFALLLSVSAFQNSTAQEAAKQVVLQMSKTLPKNPAASFPASLPDAGSAVEAWLALMDRGDYAKSWEAASDGFHRAVTREEGVAMSEKVRQPLGALISRKEISTERMASLPGMPDGSYLVAKFDTSFAALPAAIETVTFVHEQSGWKASAYLISPASSMKKEPISQAEKASVAAAETWLAGIDAGNYSPSWKESSGLFQAAITEAGWNAALTNVRKPLGALVSRTLSSARLTDALPGAPDGSYVVMQFDTSFAEKKSAVETVTFRLENDGQWKAAGYFIK